MEPDLPPPTATPLQVITGFPASIALRLFTNDPSGDNPRTLLSYHEPEYAGYSPFSTPDWLFTELDASHTAVSLAVQALWPCTGSTAPVMVRGWYATVLYADGFLEIWGEYLISSPLIIQRRGDTVVSLVTLTLTQQDAPELRYLLVPQSVLLLAEREGSNVKFRGNDRRIVKHIADAMDAASRRDANWPNRSRYSKQADVQIIPTTDTALVAAWNLILTRMSDLLLMQ